MVVRVRLARHGTRNNPFFHIVAIQDKAARNARPIEKLGEYDPIPRPRVDHEQASTVGMPSTSARPHVIGPVLTSGLEKMQEGERLEKRIEWNVERIRHWLDVGAQPSKPVARLLDRAGLIPEGKFYKGMYRPEGVAKGKPEGKPAASKKGAPASVILEAAGVSREKQASAAQNATAAAALRQGEVVAEQARRTDPEAEALKKQKGEGTIDQAA